MSACQGQILSRYQRWYHRGVQAQMPLGTRPVRLMLETASYKTTGHVECVAQGVYVPKVQMEKSK